MRTDATRDRKKSRASGHGRRNDLRGNRLDGDEVRLVEVDGEIIAHAIVCPHLGGPLEAAPIVDGCVTCPWHGYRYDVRSGRCADHEKLALPIARVTIDADGNTTLSR
jgi:nitrite reductase/ring-hydroxylating ferredoxin subunit